MTLNHGKMGQELAQITSINDSIATWREDSKYLNHIITYPRDMSTPSILLVLIKH
jgi:hypothetical protein